MNWDKQDLDAQNRHQYCKIRSFFNGWIKFKNYQF